jgi:hypothetical protein
MCGVRYKRMVYMYMQHKLFCDLYDDYLNTTDDSYCRFYIRWHFWIKSRDGKRLPNIQVALFHLLDLWRFNVIRMFSMGNRRHCHNRYFAHTICTCTYILKPHMSDITDGIERASNTFHGTQNVP